MKNSDVYFGMIAGILLMLIGGATLYMIISTKGATSVPWVPLLLVALACIFLGGWTFREYLRIRHTNRAERVLE